MKYLEISPISSAKAKNLAALKQYAGGSLHPSSTCNALVPMLIDEESNRAELRIEAEYEQYFSQSDRNTMTTEPVIPDPVLPSVQGGV